MTAATTALVGEHAPTRLAQIKMWRTSADLHPRNNSLNLIRLVLATSVFVSHSFAVVARGPEPTFAGETLGGWAVIGFFVISGYLITASRMRSSMGTFLVHRIARIFPAFLTCLIVTALVFGPVAFYVQSGSLDGYLTTPNTPFNYVFANAGLKVADYSLAGTLATVPYPGVWNGPLWTLYYEFLCYLAVGFLCLAAVVRRNPAVLIGFFGLTVAVRMNLDTLSGYTAGNIDVILLSKLLPYFLGGAVIYTLRHRIPLRWWVALPALTVGLLLVVRWNFWGGQLAAPLYAIGILWIATWLPSPNFIKRNDISYGVYIYAWPVQQLLALASVYQIGHIFYNVATGIITALLATTSWLLVERPVMRRARQAGVDVSAPIPEPVSPVAAGSVIPEPAATGPATA